MVIVSVVAAPPKTSVELANDFVTTGLEIANTLMLWLTAPLLETAPPSFR